MLFVVGVLVVGVGVRWGCDGGGGGGGWEDAVRNMCNKHDQESQIHN